MKVFKLPDLGEGLPDATVREWLVREGDSVAADQALVTVETAKALVEVPSPYSGTVEKLYVAEGETLQTGQPLVGFTEPASGQASDKTREKTPEKSKSSGEDSGTVVGKIESGSVALAPEQRPMSTRSRNATPAVRALARQLGVDLSRLHPAGSRFSEAEVRAAAGGHPPPAREAAPAATREPAPAPATSAEPARRAMALAMSRSRDLVCPMTLCDEVDISDWPKGTSTTLRLLRAIAHAAASEPNLNAHFDNDTLAPQTPVNIGLAVDAPRGLFVPVLKDIAGHSDGELLDTIARFKQQADEGGIPQSDLQGATIHLSNFGSIIGRFATPVVLPPLVCIVGAGRSHKAVLPHKGKARVRKLLPLSLTADHRAVTGGELARFLKALKEHLES
ncbi:dihydrolipoamide acetyltransferase family protein [Microbulbifer harenosus]|uniref:Dihydrolipoamide acetyltransferase component of pyruvate dehydrogenase complex n=1 Tax=Microbulbifer harenosus TaxID=2576840 RepID=A0ABY2UET4_9GAMM|nr:dihydrolipoamide acetyltransferase family protein [Microbulbifer harenosus]TLM75771.1 2-oxo acid dehydrogenase subunit E2 [Microbulbifer harenosus]